MMKLLKWNNRLQLHSLCIAHGLQRCKNTREWQADVCRTTLWNKITTNLSFIQFLYKKNLQESELLNMLKYRIKKKCIRLHTGIYKETQRNVKNLYTGFTSLKISEIQTIYGELCKFLIQIPLFKLCLPSYIKQPLLEIKTKPE